MGRNKLKIEKLKTNGGRQVTYSKRKSGIMKKARELSILCDADVLLLMFSTTGKPSIFMGEKSSFEDVIEKYANISPQERNKRKLESLDTLKKTFKNDEHEVNIDKLLDQGSQRAEDIQTQVDNFKKQIDQTSAWLGPLGLLANLDNVNSLDDVSAIEQALGDAINSNMADRNGMNQQFDLNGPLISSTMFPYFHNDSNQMLYPQNSTFYPRDPRGSAINDSDPELANYSYSSNLGIGIDAANDPTTQGITWPQSQFDGIERSIRQDQNWNLREAYPQSLAGTSSTTDYGGRQYSDQIAQQEETNFEYSFPREMQNAETTYEYTPQPGEMQNNGINFEYTVQPGEMQNNRFPETNLTSSSIADIFQLPECYMSDNEFVNSMFGRNIMSLDSIEEPNFGFGLNPNGDSSAVLHDANFQSWASGV